MTKVKTQEIHAVRDTLAHLADGHSNSLKQFQLVANWINSIAGENFKLLEIGCGSGILSRYVTAQYSGIDPIEHAGLSREVDFKVGLGENIPHPNQSFNYVLVKDAINYFSNLNPVFDEASRVITDSGGILVTEFVGESYHPLKQKIKNIVKKYLRIRRNIWDQTYLNYYTSHDIIKVAKQHGYTISYKYHKSDSRYYLLIYKNGPGL